MNAALAVALIAAFPGADLTQLSDAPAGNPAISQDKRFGRLVAFESGGNIVAVHRAEPYGENGTPWQAGRREVVSVGLGGAPANGPSSAPSVDGTSRVAPHCVAFVSAASNLVRGDTNGKPDAFVRDLRTGVTKRVSVTSRGRQSNGTVTEVAVDGLCRRVAFVSDAGDLALRKTKNRNWKTAVTRANPPGRRQVYLHLFGGTTGIDRAMKKLTFLASATDKGRPGNADSHSIAYATNADRLIVRLRRHEPLLERPQRRHRRLPARDEPPLRQEDQGPPLAVPAHGHEARLGRRQRPRGLRSVDLAGEQRRRQHRRVRHHGVRSRADRRGRADRQGGGAERHRAPAGPLASTTAGRAPGNGASAAPSLTAAGTWVLFESDATNVGVTSSRQPDTNGVRDAMLATEPSGDRWLLGEGGAGGPTTNPMTSPHGNYVVFERGGTVHLLYVGEK